MACQYMPFVAVILMPRVLSILIGVVWIGKGSIPFRMVTAVAEIVTLLKTPVGENNRGGGYCTRRASLRQLDLIRGY